MLNKIYFAVLAAAIAVMIFFMFYGRAWLGSLGSPQSALEGFDYYAGLSSTVLWISSALLLILANVILWNSRKGWAMWATFVYFAVFVVLRTFWLERARHEFQNADGLFYTPVLGVALIVGAGAIVFFNQFVNLRLNEKMYPPAADAGNTGFEENSEVGGNKV